ncbi:hypothetical protein [Natronomonas sp. EA1]|uniref:hypothetical protein n=1 Tax=Natronomonas sp. EA1 TaxID=3421655 RepID=UPI003EBEE656
MTTVVVLCQPPRPGSVLTDLVATSPLSETEAAQLYAAMTTDIVRAVEHSGGELLLNYRDVDDEAEAEVREMVAAETEDPRCEVQVGETFSGIAGNTVTHLLETEEVVSAAIVEPSAAFLTRQVIDTAAMKLRRSEVVLGPTPSDGVYYAGFTDPIDFTDAYTAPPLETLTDRGLDSGYDVDFLQQLPVIETGADLAAALPLLRARERAGRIVPPHTMEAIREFGVAAVPGEDGLELRRE